MVFTRSQLAKAQQAPVAGRRLKQLPVVVAPAAPRGRVQRPPARGRRTPNNLPPAKPKPKTPPPRTPHPPVRRKSTTTRTKKPVTAQKRPRSTSRSKQQLQQPPPKRSRRGSIQSKKSPKKTSTPNPQSTALRQAGNELLIPIDVVKVDRRHLAAERVREKEEEPPKGQPHDVLRMWSNSLVNHTLDTGGYYQGTTSSSRDLLARVVSYGVGRRQTSTMLSFISDYLRGLSARDRQPILQALAGHGHACNVEKEKAIHTIYYLCRNSLSEERQRRGASPVILDRLRDLRHTILHSLAVAFARTHNDHYTIQVHNLVAEELGLHTQLDDHVVPSCGVDTSRPLVLKAFWDRYTPEAMVKFLQLHLCVPDQVPFAAVQEWYQDIIPPTVDRFAFHSMLFCEETGRLRDDAVVGLLCRCGVLTRKR